jgi:hypothetical protein
MPRPKKYREVIHILMAYDRRFEVWAHRGKGSERIIYHPMINGRPESFPIKCHGENTEIRSGVISSLIRRFNLPKNLFS